MATCYDLVIEGEVVLKVELSENHREPSRFCCNSLIKYLQDSKKKKTNYIDQFDLFLQRRFHYENH